MSRITMTATYTYNGVTYTSGQSYYVRSKDAEQIMAANKAAKSVSRKKP